jgi:hypothetical protein
VSPKEKSATTFLHEDPNVVIFSVFFRLLNVGYSSDRITFHQTACIMRCNVAKESSSVSLPFIVILSNNGNPPIPKRCNNVDRNRDSHKGTDNL